MPGPSDSSELQAAGQDPDYQAQLRSEMNRSATVEFESGEVVVTASVYRGTSTLGTVYIATMADPAA